MSLQAVLERIGERDRAIGAPDDRAHHANHLKNLGDAALVERNDGVAAPDELGGNIRLQIGEGQDQIGLERLNLVESSIDERRYFRLVTRFRRPHRVARDADDAIAFAEQVERFGRLFRQANDSRRVSRAHAVVIIS